MILVTFLISKQIVAESKVTCYVNLVTRCLKDAHKRFSEELAPAENHFLRRLSKTKEQWQIDQATLSLRIYQYSIKARLLRLVKIFGNLL